MYTRKHSKIEFNITFVAMKFLISSTKHLALLSISIKNEGLPIS